MGGTSTEKNIMSPSVKFVCFSVSLLSRHGRVLGVVEHVVAAGSDVRLPCELEGSEDQVVVWRVAGPGHQDRILSVGKMLVRNDGKGNKYGSIILDKRNKRNGKVRIAA